MVDTQPHKPPVQVLLHSIVVLYQFSLNLIIFQILFTYSSMIGYYNLPCVGQFLKIIQKLKRAESIHT